MSNRYTFETPEQVHRHAMFVEGNPFLKDGRTYVERDEDGNYISSFVSQYSNIIEDNLEPGVKEAVLKLNEKGYLTFTSCQGHDDSKYRYIGVLFNTMEQKQQFISEVNKLRCDIHWYDNIINSVERPAKPSKSKGNITIHIVWDDQDYNDTTQAERRNKTYTDLELTKFWNVQTCRNYQHYEAIVFSFGYPMVEKNIFQRLQKQWFYNENKITTAYDQFCSRVHKLSEYLC